MTKYKLTKKGKDVIDSVVQGIEVAKIAQEQHPTLTTIPILKLAKLMIETEYKIETLKVLNELRKELSK